MGCLVTPASMLRRLSTSSSLRYRPLTDDGFGESDGGLVTVVVGREKREFLVDPLVLEKYPFRILLDSADRIQKGSGKFYGKRRVVFVDNVDAILFEHLLWLLRNDPASFLKLNLMEIIDFYAQDS